MRKQLTLLEVAEWFIWSDRRGTGVSQKMRGVFVNSQWALAGLLALWAEHRLGVRGQETTGGSWSPTSANNRTINFSCDWCESDLTLIPSTASIHLPNSVFIGVLSSTYHIFHALILYSCWQKGQQDRKLGARVSMHNKKGSLSRLNSSSPNYSPCLSYWPILEMQNKEYGTHKKKKFNN